jgi:hypothetical protein
VRRLFSAFGDATPPHDSDVLIRFLNDQRHSFQDWEAPLSRQGIELFWHSPEMVPNAAAMPWGVPAITTTTALAEWLGVTLGQLDWLAVPQSRTVGEG